MAYTKQKEQAESVTGLKALKAHPSHILCLVKLHIPSPKGTTNWETVIQMLEHMENISGSDDHIPLPDFHRLTAIS